MQFILKARDKKSTNEDDWFIPSWHKPNDINETYRILEGTANQVNYDWRIEHVEE